MYTSLTHLLEHNAIWLNIGESASGDQRPLAPTAGPERSAAAEAETAARSATLEHQQRAGGHEGGPVATSHAEPVRLHDTTDSTVSETLDTSQKTEKRALTSKKRSNLCLSQLRLDSLNTGLVMKERKPTYTYIQVDSTVVNKKICTSQQ